MKKCSAFFVEYLKKQDGLCIKLAGNKSYCHDITEILLKVALNTIRHFNLS
jgi:hypothetical protein